MTANRRLSAICAVVFVLVAVTLELTPGQSVGAVRGTTITIPLALVAVVTGVVYSTLLLRWRWPLRVYLLVWAFSLAGLLLPQFSPFVGLLVALHAVASRMPRRPAVAALLLAMVPLSINAANGARVRQNLEAPEIVSFAGQFALYLVLAVTAWGMGRLSLAAQERAEQQRVAAAAEAIRAEQIRLAREIHDIVSHAVTGMLLQAAGAKSIDREQDLRVLDALTVIETTGVQAMTELHRLLGLLRAAEDSPASTRVGWQPNLEQVDTLLNLTRASGMNVDLITHGTAVPLEPEVSLAVYRMIQEALTNAVKHAGRGAQATVTLRWGHDQLIVSIQDQGGEVSDSVVMHLSGGLGLRGLQERAKQLGGDLNAGPVSGGFLVEAAFPCLSLDNHQHRLTAAGTKRPRGSR